MAPEQPKDDVQEHLRENRILIAVFLVILLVLIWKPFQREPERILPPELSGIENNLQLREVIERLQQQGGGRLYPPRGYGGLAPHQSVDDAAAATGTDAVAEDNATPSDGEPAPAPAPASD